MEGRPRQAVTPLENGAVAVAGCTSLGLATVSFLLPTMPVGNAQQGSGIPCYDDLDHICDILCV